MSSLSLGVLSRGWRWFIDGLTEAWLWVAARSDRRPVLHAEQGEEGFILKAENGIAVGRVIETPEGSSLELMRSPKAFVGGRIDLHVPAPWLFRRTLDPVPAESAPYLDGFVRHQLERITPWRVGDVHYQIRHAPLQSDPGRLSVEVGVIPRRMVQKSLQALTDLRPKQIRLVTTTADGAAFQIDLAGGSDAGTPRLSRLIGNTVGCVIVCLTASIAWATWEASALQADLDTQDQVISERRNVAAAAQRRDRAGAEADGALRKLRDAQARTVDVIEALSTAIPDTAYLTDLTIEKDRVTISGVSKDLSQLVPALETAGRFKSVAFSAATTRVEAGEGDVFHLDMQIAAPKPEVAAP